MAQKLLLVRHAALSSEFAGQLLGTTDIPLSSTGLHQAQALAQLRILFSANVCLSSPLLRARQTAEAIWPSAKPVFQLDENLREINFGHWEGLSFAELSARFPAEVAGWNEWDPGFGFPGGETLAGFETRIRALAQQLAGHSADTVLAITHGGIIRALICHFLGLSLRNYLLFNILPASLAMLDIQGQRGVLSGLNLISQETA